MNDQDNVFSPMKILIVDDTPANIDVLRKFMTESGYDISIAPDGKIALKIINNSKPDLILLDVMMPGIDGFEVCRHLKENDDTKDIPVIFVTAKTETSDIVQGFQVGGVDYITKPFEREEVLSRVKTHLKIQNLIKEKTRFNEILSDKNDELVESENQYRIIIDKTADGIFRLDKNGKILHSNEKFCSLLEFSSAEIEGKNISDLLNTEAPAKILPQVATKRFGERATRGLKVQFCINENSNLWKERKYFSLLVDSFGIWNLPNNILVEKGSEKKFLGTLCVVKKPD
ncbi:MAG: response regulator [Nitrospinae bacterium]|nr:response regulator [Nitrospinota bacterium]